MRPKILSWNRLDRLQCCVPLESSVDPPSDLFRKLLHFPSDFGGEQFSPKELIRICTSPSVYKLDSVYSTEKGKEYLQWKSAAPDAENMARRAEGNGLTTEIGKNEQRREQRRE
jgi:hypothetical protein